VRPFYSALLDGKQIKSGEGNSLIDLPFKEMADGYHEVRLIAQAAIPVTPGGFKDIPVFINKKDRSVKITDMTDRDPQQIVVIAASGGEDIPSEMGLLWNGRELARAAVGDELVFDERIVGEGPQRIQVVAVYGDGMEVRSEPVVFTITFNEKDEE